MEYEYAYVSEESTEYLRESLIDIRHQIDAIINYLKIELKPSSNNPFKYRVIKH